MVRVLATPCVARDLAPGDLFSTVGPQYWSGFADFDGVGERVYIRTLTPVEGSPDPDLGVFRIEIVKEAD